MAEFQKIGEVAVMEVEDILLLKTVQSPVEIHPACEPLATEQPTVNPEPIMDCPAVTVIPPLAAIVPVATCPRRAGVAELDVQYAKYPATSFVEVLTFPDPLPAVAFRVLPDHERFVPAVILVEGVS